VSVNGVPSISCTSLVRHMREIQTMRIQHDEVQDSMVYIERDVVRDTHSCRQCSCEGSCPLECCHAVGIPHIHEGTSQCKYSLWISISWLSFLSSPSAPPSLCCGTGHQIRFPECLEQAVCLKLGISPHTAKMPSPQCKFRHINMSVSSTIWTHNKTQ